MTFDMNFGWIWYIDMTAGKFQMHIVGHWKCICYVKIPSPDEICLDVLHLTGLINLEIQGGSCLNVHRVNTPKEKACKIFCLYVFVCVHFVINLCSYDDFSLCIITV